MRASHRKTLPAALQTFFEVHVKGRYFPSGDGAPHLFASSSAVPAHRFHFVHPRPFVDGFRPPGAAVMAKQEGWDMTGGSMALTDTTNL